MFLKYEFGQNGRGRTIYYLMHVEVLSWRNKCKDSPGAWQRKSDSMCDLVYAVVALDQVTRCEIAKDIILRSASALEVIE
ncbi:hypothetical protein Mapa_007910 [Marchantia paleacea]|nr:hypothetical protein Mapa_007910 [Marchantia paleacea]